MITLHRLGHPTRDLHVNHDMIVTIEANPDTVITLTTGVKIVVAEPPADVSRVMRECRAEILSLALSLQAEDRVRTDDSSLTPGPWLRAVPADLPIASPVPDGFFESA